MAYTRMNPVSVFDELRREIGRLFDGYGPGLGPVSALSTARFPALNIWEDGEALYAEAELPGVSPQDLEVYAVGNELTIKGRRGTALEEGACYHRRERGTGEFTRVVTLPVEVDAEKVEAALKNGVLTVTLPKADEVKPRKIAVQAG
ncbi:MAG: Hsp20/alpha crystallin family protein [Phycisphaerales bacterium]|nr:Hsp20/alpha crystallin family protein [Phycisphaerales bacterium]